jgi:hypothetical protein
LRAVIQLELIADDYFWHVRHKSWSFDKQLRYMRRLGHDKSPSWVARLHPGMKREYLHGVRDYSRANATGSRGIFELFVLRDGVYEINDRYHWNKVHHYYALAEGETITEIGREEAAQWLEAKIKNTSA